METGSKHYSASEHHAGDLSPLTPTSEMRSSRERRIPDGVLIIDPRDERDPGNPSDTEDLPVTQEGERAEMEKMHLYQEQCRQRRLENERAGAAKVTWQDVARVAGDDAGFWDNRSGDSDFRSLKTDSSRERSPNPDEAHEIRMEAWAQLYDAAHQRIGQKCKAYFEQAEEEIEP